MSSDIEKDSFSENLNESFKDYRETQEYKIQLEERRKSLEVLGIFDEFAWALAQDSLETWIKVSELLEVKDEILRENKRLMDLIGNTAGPVNDIINNKPDNVIDITNRLSNNRVYWWKWAKTA